jgi:3-methyladenine DNA glycosylase AlkD
MVAITGIVTIVAAWIITVRLNRLKEDSLAKQAQLARELAEKHKREAVDLARYQEMKLLLNQELTDGEQECPPPAVPE